MGNGCRARHWFTLRGLVGVRSPVCVRCGAPNPRPLSDQELAECRYWQGYRDERRDLEEQRREYENDLLEGMRQPWDLN